MTMSQTSRTTTRRRRLAMTLSSSSRSPSPIKLTLLTLLSLAVLASAACPPGDCEPYGRCVLEDTPECREAGTCEERCVCHEGFSGPNCSFLRETCPSKETTTSRHHKSVSACFNGGTCFPEPNADGTDFDWQCDCSKSLEGVISGQWRSSTCEFRKHDTVSCEVGVEVSEYAFCVNGGSCGDNAVLPGQVFKGCTCPEGLEGRHCQFPAGSNVGKGFLADANSTKTSYQHQRRMSVGSACAIALVALVAAVALGNYLANVATRRHAEEKNSKTVGTTETDNDEHTLQLEEVDIHDQEAPPLSDREII